MSKGKQQSSMWSWELVKPALTASWKKLNPLTLYKNPVMLCVEITAILATALTVYGALVPGAFAVSYLIQLTLWLWFTVLFGNFAEALAESKGKAQADSLRKTQSQLTAKRCLPNQTEVTETIPATQLQVGDVVIVDTDELIPADGEVIAGMAMVNESAITGESAPVMRESGGDHCAVTAGTTVISDRITVKVTTKPGEGFLDKMIALVEGASRQKTPNEIALNILLVGFTVIFVIATATLEGFSLYSHHWIPLILLLVLFVTLIPTTIAGLLSAIGISGMERLLKCNVLAKSGRAVEAAGDIDTLLLDKTGTITLGDRHATEFVAMPGVNEKGLAEAALLSSLSDETPEGRSIVTLVTEKYHLHANDYAVSEDQQVPFSAYTRMSGVDLPSRSIRKGAVAAIEKYIKERQGQVPASLNAEVERIAKAGATPLVVAENNNVLGVIYLKDVIKPGIQERFAEMRRLGLRTVMVTGDNPLTAAAIAAEAGVDDFVAQADPETKLKYIRDVQAEGKMVAMCGDGTNDAPALAQADLGLAMASGTSAAREAANMVDLDSDPTKLIEVIKVGKQLLMTRGALTTFSISNDLAKYFAIIPALFIASMPQLQALNIMHLHSANTAILAAIMFNALIIIALVPMALKGVRYRVTSAVAMLRKNLIVFGLGGIIAPFIGIKCLDMVLVAFGMH